MSEEGHNHWSEIDGEMDDPACERLVELAAGKICLEVGVKHGKSASALAQRAKYVLAIDCWDDVNGEMQVAVKALHKYGNLALCRGRSQDVLPLLRDRSFDVVHIDGDHGFSTATSDLLEAYRLVAPGGCVLCHDYPAISDVQRAVDELIASGTFRLVGTFGNCTAVLERD